MPSPIRTPTPINLVPQRVQVGDTLEFVDKINQTQATFETFSDELNTFSDDLRTVAGEAEHAAQLAISGVVFVGVWDPADGDPPVPSIDGQAINGFYRIVGDGLLHGQAVVSGDELMYEVDADAWFRIGRDRDSYSKVEADERYYTKDASDNRYFTKDASDNRFEARFPAGTRMLFQQSTAPVGWVKVTDAAMDDRALRIVTGAVSQGGSAGFKAAFNSSVSVSEAGAHGHEVTVAGRSLTKEQIPSLYSWIYYVPLKLPSVGGVFTYEESSVIKGTDISNGNAPLNLLRLDVGRSHSHDHAANASSAEAHSHAFNLNVAYTDVIIAVKQ